MSNDRRTRREPAPQASTSKRRGRAFAKGHDPRRNTGGRRAKAARSPSEEVLAAVMTPTAVRVNGKLCKKPKLRVVVDQHMHAAMQGDQAAARVLATLIRACAALISRPQGEKNATGSTLHDEKKLLNLLKEHEHRLIQGANISSQGSGK